MVDAHIHPLCESEPAIYQEKDVAMTEARVEQNATATFQEAISVTDRAENSTLAYDGDQKLTDPPKLSKNALKKVRRQEAWLEKKKDRRFREKQKKKEARLRKRDEILKAQAETRILETKDVVQNGLQPSPPPTGIVAADSAVAGQKRKVGENESVEADGQSKSATVKKQKIKPIKVPIGIIIDCGFDDCMTEKVPRHILPPHTYSAAKQLEQEICSLSSQVTRCYSQNRQSPMQVQLSITSFGGRLKHRMETTLSSTHKKWKQVKFSEEEYQVTEQNRNDRDLVYLSSDSDHTLQGLEEGKTYIIGGIVDRNRHKVRLLICSSKMDTKIVDPLTIMILSGDMPQKSYRAGNSNCKTPDRGLHQDGLPGCTYYESGCRDNA